MGLKQASFVAATNANDIIPNYLQTGIYQPRPSVQTLSNAMDVGDPSNFWRLHALFDEELEAIQAAIKGYSFDDAATVSEMKRVYNVFGYVLDPHAAVASLAWNAQREENTTSHGIILETAHPTKFLDVVENALGFSPEVPERLAVLKDKEKNSILLPKGYPALKSWLLS
jgi:threonine synthase